MQQMLLQPGDVAATEDALARVALVLAVLLGFASCVYHSLLEDTLPVASDPEP